MSKIAKVLIISKAINHFLWPFLADFHRAIPFQGSVQSKIGSKINVSSIYLKIYRAPKFLRI